MTILQDPISLVTCRRVVVLTSHTRSCLGAWNAVRINRELSRCAGLVFPRSDGLFRRHLPRVLFRLLQSPPVVLRPGSPRSKPVHQLNRAVPGNHGAPTIVGRSRPCLGRPAPARCQMPQVGPSVALTCREEPTCKRCYGTRRMPVSGPSPLERWTERGGFLCRAQ